MAPGRFNAIDFVSDSTGWVGGNGKIIYTDNGGGSWQTQYTGSAKITQFAFPTAKVGFATTGAHNLLDTTNGGVTWMVETTPDTFSQIDFLSPSTGYAVGSSGVLYETTSSGATWRSVSTPLPVQSACFANATTAFAAGAKSLNAALYKTTDAGSSWTSVPLPALRPGFVGLDMLGWQQELACTATTLFDFIASFGPQGAYAGGASYGLYAMRLDHATWTGLAQNESFLVPRTTPQGPGYSPGELFVSGTTAYLTGTCNSCGSQALGTTVIGTNTTTQWRNIVIPNLTATSAEVSFPSPRVGWMVATSGAQPGASAVLETTNQGLSWVERYPGPSPHGS